MDNDTKEVLTKILGFQIRQAGLLKDALIQATAIRATLVNQGTVDASAYKDHAEFQKENGTASLLDKEIQEIDDLLHLLSHESFGTVQ